MKKIFDGVFVEQENDQRIYFIEAGSEHIKSVKSHESARQEIELHDNAPTEDINNLIASNGFYTEIDAEGLIHVKTEDPVKLVKLLCDAEFIDIGQATAIIANEIEHIKNPVMQKLLIGQQRLKEIREIVIRHNIALTQSARNVLDIRKPLRSRDGGKDL